MMRNAPEVPLLAAPVSVEATIWMRHELQFGSSRTLSGNSPVFSRPSSTGCQNRPSGEKSTAMTRSLLGVKERVELAVQRRLWVEETAALMVDPLAGLTTATMVCSGHPAPSRTVRACGFAGMGALFPARSVAETRNSYVWPPSPQKSSLSSRVDAATVVHAVGVPSLTRA